MLNDILTLFVILGLVCFSSLILGNLVSNEPIWHRPGSAPGSGLDGWWSDGTTPKDHPLYLGNDY